MPAGAHGLDPHFMSAVPFHRVRARQLEMAQGWETRVFIFCPLSKNQNSCNKRPILPSLVWLRGYRSTSKINVAGTHWNNDPIMTVETSGTWAMRGVLAVMLHLARGHFPRGRLPRPPNLEEDEMRGFVDVGRVSPQQRGVPSVCSSDRSLGSTRTPKLFAAARYHSLAPSHCPAASRLHLPQAPRGQRL